MDAKKLKMIRIAFIVIIVLVVIGLFIHTLLKYKKMIDLNKNTKFPPWPSKCPDYWTVVGENMCENVHKIGKCKGGDTDNTMDFNDPIFKGSKGMYYKCNWSKKCNAPWEGVDSLC